MSEITLYDYWRSSASYRLRIALNMLGLQYRIIPVNLLKKEQQNADYLALNPQGLVPALVIDNIVMSQSLSIIEYLDETRKPGLFLPKEPDLRQKVRALSYAIAMEIHAVCNLRIVAYAIELTKDENIRTKWMHKFISDGLRDFEKMLEKLPEKTFCCSNVPSMADICLVPQVYNAIRWQVDLDKTPNILRIYNNCVALPAFQKAHPDNDKST